jgi:hypothetical protein
MSCPNLNIPPMPLGNGCLKTNEDGSVSVYISDQSFTEIRKKNLQVLQTKFDEIRDGKIIGFDQHSNINCLIEYMLANLTISNNTFAANTTSLEEQKALLKTEERYLIDQENVLRSNENSDLVATYRNESTGKRNKAENTKFTIYVTMIVVFLIIEGIVFFV